MKLTSDQLQAALSDLSGWQGDDTGISRTFTFQSYAEGVAFAMKVALLAEKINHQKKEPKLNSYHPKKIKKNDPKKKKKNNK